MKMGLVPFITFIRQQMKVNVQQWTLTGILGGCPPSFLQSTFEGSSELTEEINNENQNARGYVRSIQWQRHSF